MKKLFLAAILCSWILSSCKEEEETYCYECSTTVTLNNGTGEIEMPDMSVTTDQCGLTEQEALAASTTVTTTTGNSTMKTNTVCSRK